MIPIEIAYEGELHCLAVHEPTGSEISTDAPVDNEGRGETFSPTDLLATALGSCMMTIMGIVARRDDLDLKGASVRVEKEMSKDTPRRIARLGVTLRIPLPADHPQRDKLEKAAAACPVHQSLHPDIDIALHWEWAG